MFKKMWKIILGLLIVGIIILIIRDSQGFDWKDFNYTKDTTTLETVNIGFIGSLTGFGSSAGVQALAAAQLAVDEINANGGIQGKTLRFFAEDSVCSKEGGEAAIQKLLDHNISGLVGGPCSDATEGMIDHINQYTIPTLSYCSSATTLDGVSDYLFGIYTSDTFQGLYTADYIKNSLNIDTIALVYVNDVWGNSLRDVFSESFRSQGGSIAQQYGFNRDEQDFNMWNNIVKDPKIELVYFLASEESTQQGLKVLGNRGDFIVFGTHTWSNTNLWTDFNSTHDILYTSLVLGQPIDMFKKKIQERGIYHLSSCTPHAYDAVHILADALEKHLGNPKAVSEYIAGIRYNKGVSKSLIQFNEQGDIIDISYNVERISS